MAKAGFAYLQLGGFKDGVELRLGCRLQVGGGGHIARQAADRKTGVFSIDQLLDLFYSDEQKRRKLFDKGAMSDKEGYNPGN